MDLHAALEFVAQHRRGVLITLRRDGRPQCSNIVYVVDDATIAVSVTDGRAKTANLRRDPRATLHVTTEDFGTYAVIDGTVELSAPAADPADATVEALVRYYRALAGEHPDWDDYRRAMVSDRRLLVTLRPERAYGTA
jgi:PPOX class probable F420-dependent enzyme